MEIQLSEYTKNLICKLYRIKSLDDIPSGLKVIKEFKSADEPLDEGTPIIHWQWFPKIEDGTIIIEPLRFPKNISEEEKREGFETICKFLLHSVHELFYIYKILDKNEDIKKINDVKMMKSFVGNGLYVSEN